MTELKKSTKRALIWSALDKGGQQVLLLLVGVVTMRLLDTSAFGVVAPLALFTGVANILAEGGLSAALIRKNDATERDYNTMFWFNLGLGGLFYVALFFTAPWIASYNNMPELTLIARIQFLVIPFYALGLIHSTALIKRSDFKHLGMANVISVLLAGVTVIVLAVLGFGVWAIVAQYMAQAFARMALLWTLSGWKPRFMYSWHSFREMFGFSSKIIVGTLASNVSANFYSSALGKYLPADQLGLYDRANKMTKETGAAGFMTHIFGNSIYLMLSQLQDDSGRFRQAFRRSIQTISFVLFPALLGLFAVAPALVEVVFGSRWLPAAPYMRILCLSGVFFVLNYIYANALKSKGRSDITLSLDIANAGLLVTFLYLTIRHGLEAALWADVFTKFVVFLCYSVAVRKIFGYRWIDQIKDIAPYALLSAAMSVLVWALCFVVPNLFLLLFLQILTGGAFYLSASRLFGFRVFDEVWQTLKKRKL